MKKIIKFIMMGVCIVVFLAILVFIEELPNPPTQKMHEFCQERGFNKATEFNLEYSTFGETITDIECDSDTIYYDLSKFKSCHEYDKWKKCIKSTYFYTSKAIMES